MCFANRFSRFLRLDLAHIGPNLEKPADFVK